MSFDEDWAGQQTRDVTEVGVAEIQVLRRREDNTVERGQHGMRDAERAEHVAVLGQQDHKQEH